MNKDIDCTKIKRQKLYKPFNWCT